MKNRTRTLAESDMLCYQLRKELRESLRELEQWDGTPDEMQTILANLCTAYRRATKQARRHVGKA